jgi:hypothetical protein
MLLLYTSLLLGDSRYPGLKREINSKDRNFNIFARKYDGIFEYWEFWQKL